MSVARAVKDAVYVAATRQHIGKSSVCLGLMSGLSKALGEGRVGFMKPVGQRHDVLENGDRIDRDVSMMADFFDLTACSRKTLSPVVLHGQATRNFWETGGFENTAQRQIYEDAIQSSFREVREAHSFTVVEGTGHAGVGSVVGLNNAQVAKLLGLDMVFISNGGLGKTYDDLSLNMGLAKLHGVNVRGVIINKVRKDKIDQVRSFFEPVLKQWDVPLIGLVPYGDFLDSPTIADFEELFGVERLSGHSHPTVHYTDIQIVATGLRRFLEKLGSGLYDDSLFVTHASRADVVLGFLSHCKLYEAENGTVFPGALIVAGEDTKKPGGGTIQENKHLTKAIKLNNNPIMFVQRTVLEVMSDISQHVAKLNAADVERTRAAIDLYEPHIDVQQLIEGL